MAGHVIDRDLGFAALMKALEAAGAGIEMTVGLHEEEGGEPKGDMTAVEIAELNEFGSPGGKIPPRPSITAWGDENASRVPTQIADAFRAALAKRGDPFQRCDQLAQVYAGEVQQKISGGIPPPNAESTIRKKGSSVPLIDTGTFRSSILGKVERK